MASEVVYAEVLPKERVHFVSQTSDTGNPTTYTKVNMKQRSDPPGSTLRTLHTVICSKKSHWFYIAGILYFSAVILLITVVIVAVKCHRP